MPDSSVREREEGDVEGAAQLDYPDPHTVVVKQPKVPNQTFSFDRVFHDVNVTQREVYEFAAKETVADVIAGYNGTIFAYGQTGAGKSFSMFGADVESKETKGIIPRACEHIFKFIESDSSGTEFTIKCSFLEIYKEVVRDLLDPERVNLKVRETPSRGVWVDGLSESFVTSVDDIMELLRLGEKHRATSATKMNSVSSRSHSLFILTLQQRSPDGSMKEGRLNLADLAGSEKVGKTGATGETLEEAKKINQSLSALGNCINALTKSKKGHVPYRDSRLTHILRESLGGNSKTTLLIACSPHSFNVEETISTLKFGQRAKSIKTSARINQTRSVAELEAIIAKLTRELDFWKAYGTELEKIIAEKFDKNFDFQELRKKIIATLGKTDAAAETEEPEPSSILSPPTSPRKDLDDEDTVVSAPPSPAGAAGASDIDDVEQLVGDSRSMIEMQMNLQKMKETLNLKIQDLEEDLKLAKSEREEQLQRAEQQQQELEMLQAALKKEREENKMRLEAFEYELKKAVGANEEKTDAVERALKDAQSLRDQLESLQSSKAVIEAERNKFFGVLSQAKADVLRSREEAAKSVVLEQKLFQLAERFQAQEDRRSELEAYVVKAQSNAETMQLQIAAKEQENLFLEDEVRRLRQKVSSLELQTESIKEDLHRHLMEKSNQASDSIIASDSARILSRQQDETAQLSSDLADARRANIQLQTDSAIKDVKIRELMNQIDEKAKELQRANARIETEKSAMSQLETRFKEMESQVQAQQLTKEAIDADLSESKRNISSLENQLSVVRTELERAQKDHTAQMQRVMKQLDQANERVAELEYTRDKMYDQTVEFKSLWESAKAQIAQLTAASAADHRETQSLERRLSTPVGSLTSSTLSEDSFEELESKPQVRGGNIRKPVQKTLSIGPKKSGTASPTKIQATPQKTTTAVSTAAPATPAQPTSADTATPSPSGSSAGGRTKKERGLFSRLLGESGPTKRYVSEVKQKEGVLWTHVGMLSAWKGHTFMLWDNSLHGWRSSNSDLDRDADVAIRVDGLVGIKLEPPNKFMNEKSEGAHQFTLIYPNKRQHLLGASTAAEALSWVEAIAKLNNIPVPTAVGVVAVPSNNAPVPVAIPDADISANVAGTATSPVPVPDRNS